MKERIYNAVCETTACPVEKEPTMQNLVQETLKILNEAEIVLSDINAVMFGRVFPEAEGHPVESMQDALRLTVQLADSVMSRAKQIRERL